MLGTPERPLVPNEDNQGGARIAHAYPGAAYILPADEEERNRLIMQHQFLKGAYGGQNLLAPVDWKEGDQVLDACTGTGHWIVEVASEVPGYVQLEAFDIESRLFPPVESRPKNLNMSVHSVLSLPVEWSNRFTVVHQRLLVVALRRAEWVKALKELYRVTKPGGWVELCEFICWGGGPLMNEWWDRVLRTFSKTDFYFDIGQRLESMLCEAGFVDVEVDVRKVPFGHRGGDVGITLQQVALAVWKTLGNHILKADKDLWVSREEFLKFIDRVVEEQKEIESAMSWAVFVGRKPLHHVGQ